MVDFGTRIKVKDPVFVALPFPKDILPNIVSAEGAGRNHLGLVNARKPKKSKNKMRHMTQIN